MEFLQTVWKPIKKSLMFVGKVQSTLLLAAVYYLVIGLVAILLKMVGLFKNKRVKQNSYWVSISKIDNESDSLIRQF